LVSGFRSSSAYASDYWISSRRKMMKKHCLGIRLWVTKLRDRTFTWIRI
jgi:hypothetical protein